MTIDNYLVLARQREQQKFWQILAGAVGGSLLLHAIAAVVFNALPQTALDNPVEVTLVDSSELPPDFPASPSPTPSVKISLTSTPPPSYRVTPTPSVKITPTPTPMPSVKITPTPTPTPSVKITPTPTPTPSVKITPTPTPIPSAKITPTPTPIPVKIVTQPTKSQSPPIQQTTESIYKPSDKVSPGIIATNPFPTAQSNVNKIEGSSPDSQTTGGNQTLGTTTKNGIAEKSSTPSVPLGITSPNSPTAPLAPKAIDRGTNIPIDPNNNKNPDSSSSTNLGEKGQRGSTNPNPPGAPADTGGSGTIGDPSSTVSIIPGGDDLLSFGGGNNSNNQLPTGTTPGQQGSGLSGKPGELPGATRGNNLLGDRPNSQLTPGQGDSLNPGGSGTINSKKPGIASQSTPTSSPGNGSGGTSKPEIQKHFGELACLKNCKHVYPGIITEFKQVKVSIKLDEQGRVIQASIPEPGDHPRFDNFAKTKFKEMIFQLPPGSNRDFIVTMEFKKSD